MGRMTTSKSAVCPLNILGQSKITYEYQSHIFKCWDKWWHNVCK